MAEIKYNRVDPNSIVSSPSADYSASVNPQTILKDPRFLNDLRAYYEEKGEGSYLQDDEIVDKFYSDQTWGTLNTVSALSDAAEALSASADQKARMNRIQSVYNQLPNFWQEGGRGAGAALSDGIGAVIADPINLIPGVNAYAKGVTGARAATMAGQSALRAGVKEGAKAGARSEALISGAQEGIVNTANQVRDVQLGLQDEFSLGELGTSTAIGATVGGGVGGLIGAGAGAVAAREGMSQGEAARFLGISPEQANQMTSEELNNMVEQAQSSVGPYQSPEARAETQTQQATDADAPQQEIDPVDVEFAGAEDKISAVVKANREVLARLKLDEADEELVADAQRRLEAVARLRGMVDRLKKEQEEIINLGMTSDPASLKRRNQRLSIFETDRANFEVLLRQTDTLDTEELIARIEEMDRQAREAAESGAQGQVQEAIAEEAEEAVGGDAETPPAASPEAGAVAEPPAEAAPAPVEAAEEVVETPPTEPASTETPEVATIPYRNDAQRDNIASVLRSADMSEDDLRALIADGQVEVGKDGKLTRKSMSKISAIADIRKGEAELTRAVARPDEPTPEVTDAPVVPDKAPDITEDLRGEALFSGVDYRTVTPSEKSKDGRVTKRRLRSEINKRQKAETEPDEYAVQVRKDFDSIFEELADSGLSDDEMSAAIRLLGSDVNVKSDADDLVSMFRYLSRMADESDNFVTVSNASEAPFTQTEVKKIKRLARQMSKEQGLSIEAATTLAEAKIRVQRGVDTTPVRGSGEAIEDARKFDTAGRTKSGRIQSILRRGTRIGKGSDYTYTGKRVDSREFGFEAALLKARQGNPEPLTGKALEKAEQSYNKLINDGVAESRALALSGLGRNEQKNPDIVEFELTGKMKVMTREGMKEMPKGSVAYADAITGRAYESPELAIQIRDGGRKSSTPNTAPEPDKGASDARMAEARKFLEAGDLEGFRRALKVVKATEAAPPRTSSQAAKPMPETIPLERGDKLLIARKKSDPSDVRMISPKQAAQGKDITAIIGRKSDIEDWEYKYAPANRHSYDQNALRALYDALPAEDAGVTPRGMRSSAGMQTGMGEPVPAEDAGKFIIDDLTDAEIEIVSKYARRKFSRTEDDISLAHIYMTQRIIDGTRWPKSVEGIDEIVNDLQVVNGILNRVAPQGIRLSDKTRADSIKVLDAVFHGHPSGHLEEARNFLTRLGGDPTMGPNILNQSGFEYSTSINAQKGIGEAIRVGSPEVNVPKVSVLYHEVAHWAYVNILTPQDRLDFWNAMRKYYDADGKNNKEFLNGLYAYNGMEIEGGRITGGNHSDSPQEFFANQFMVWATRKGDPVIQNQAYWERIKGYVKAIFDRFISGAKIDPDLEPLFAKILPPEEAGKFKLGVDATPTTEAGRHYQKRFLELKMLRTDIEDAFERDSADAIGTAAGEIVKYLLSVAPRRSTEARPNTGTLAPLRGLYQIIHQRIDDLDEIVSGKPFEYDGLGADVDRVAPEWLDMGMQDVADPQAVADLIRDHYHRGYSGSFEPSKGYPGKIDPENEAQMQRTSLAKLLDMIETKLEGAYKSKESGNMVAGATPETQPSSKSGRPATSKAVKAAKKKTSRAKKAVMDDAKKTAGTPASKRTRADAKTTKDVDPTVAGELKTKPIDELQKMYVAHRGTPTGDQIAIELVAKEKAQPLPEAPVAITREMQTAREDDLRRMLTDALYDGDSEKVTQVSYEIRRRAVNRGRKKNQLPRIEPVFKDSMDMIRAEITDNFGVASSDGIPPSSRASIREVLSYITHRDPEIQVAARTMTYRMLNMMGKTARGTLENTNVMTAGDIAKIANVDPSDVGTAVFADLRSPEFRKLRSDMRRMAIGLTKGDSNPFDVIHEVGHAVVRSGNFPAEEMNSIREAYRMSDDATKKRIQSAYGSKYANRIDGLQDDLLAEEWFAESLAEYMSERVARGDILGAITSGNIGNLKLRNSFDRAIDRAIEYVAYVVNGLVGRNDIKQQFRRLFLFGDMFENAAPNPLSGVTRSGPAVHPSIAVDAAHDSIMSSPKTRLNKMRNFVQDGLSHNGDDDFVVFYHGTPNGYAFRRQDNPDVIMRSSSNGDYGPGIYLGDNPDVASEVYSKRPTLESVRNQIMDADLSDEDKSELIFDAMDLNETRIQISKHRRKYAELVSQDAETEVISDVRSALDDFVEREQTLMDNLSEKGIKTDPMVIPTLIRVKNPADFQESRFYAGADEPFIKGILNYLNMTDSVDAKSMQKFNNAMSIPQNGRDTYKNFIKLLVANGRSKGRAQAEFNEILEDLGYDGMVTTHSNTLNKDGGDVMANFSTYEGSSATYRGVIVFNPENVKHIDADEFDVADERLYQRAKTAMPRGTAGNIASALQDGTIEHVDQMNVGSLGEALEVEGTNPSTTSAIMSMLRGRKLDVKEEQAMRKAGPLGFLRSQSARMEDMGANWLAGWYKTHFPDLHQKFAKKYFPIHHALRGLPDADGKVRAWARSASGGVGQKQPQSYTRIVKALRYGAGSRPEKNLNAQERAIWNQIRTAFANERRELIGQGVYVGDRGPNYMPQVWNSDYIQKNREEFMAKMMRYYKVEKTAKGVLGTDDEALDFANGLYETLAGEGADGIYVPIKGGSRNPKFDNVDFSRVIELEKYPEMMKELEPFLESDLEFLLVKYFEGSSRRMAHVEKLGINSHAFYDYMMVAEQGVDGVARLLSRNKQFVRDIRALNESGYPEYGSLVDTIQMPFEGDEGAAREFANTLTQTYIKDGRVAAKQMLDEIAVRDAQGNVPLTYQRRADAILGAIEDYKGKTAGWQPNDYEFAENAMRVAMKKPQVGTGAKTLMNTSKALRSFNNITLLGFTTLTSLGDLVLPVIRSGSVMDWAKGLRNLRDPEYKQMIHDVGVAMENIVHERMVYMYGAVDNKLSNAFFNATMLTPWTDMNRKIAGATGYEALKTMQKKAFKYAHLPLEERPAEYRTAHRFLTRYGLGDFLPEGSKQSVSLSDRALLNDDEAVRMAVIKFADEAIFQPNPNDIPLWAQTPVGALVFQLKSFPLMMTRLGKYVIDEAMQGNVKPLGYFATLGPAFGMATLSAKDIIQMRGGNDEESPELRRRNILKALGYDEKIHGNENDFLGWYVEGMMVMGGLGLLGDIMHSTVSQVDNGAYGKMRIASTFLGPSFGTGMAAVDVMAGASDAVMDSTDSNAKERTATRELATRIPVLGGIRRLREGIVDAVAGDTDDGKSNPWSKSWDSGWK